MLRRPLLLLAVLVPALTLLLADLALAQAGGGSGGFGGGGGGGGAEEAAASAAAPAPAARARGGGLIEVLFIIGVFVVIFFGGGIAIARERRKRRLRRERVHAAAAEAAAGRRLPGRRAGREGGRRPVAGHPGGLGRSATRPAWPQLVGQDLMVEWRRRLADFESKGWHNRVQVSNAPDRELRGPGEPRGRQRGPRDRAHRRRHDLVRADRRRRSSVLRDGASSEQVTIAEYWTLARSGDGWMCVSIEQEAEGGHHLDAAIVATPESDTERIRGEAVTELAAADAVPEGFTTADLAVFDFQGTRARGGAGPVAGRRALRARRAGGGRPPRGGRLGRGRGRRRRRAGAPSPRRRRCRSCSTAPTPAARRGWCCAARACA